MGDELLEMIAIEGESVRLKFSRVDGKTVDLELTNIMPGKFTNDIRVLYGIDITVMNQSVELLHRREARYRSIVENASCMICECRNGHVIDINVAGLSLLNEQKKENIIDRELAQLFHENYRELFVSSIDALIDETRPVPVRLAPRNGECRDVEVILTALDGSAGNHLLVEVRDISAQNKALKALRQLNENLEVRVDERTQTLRLAQERLAHTSKLEAIGTFAGGIAHEINTPIQFISDNLKFLEKCFADLSLVLDSYRSPLSKAHPGDEANPVTTKSTEPTDDPDLDFILEETPNAISQSISGVSHIAMVIQAMRDFSVSRMTELSKIELGVIVNSMISSLKSEYESCARFKWEAPSEKVVIDGDAQELQRAIRLIVDNGVQAIRDRGSELGEITISLSKVSSTAVLEITDNGVGMSQEDAKRAFDPFFTTRDVGKGIGQGLAICHYTIKNSHNGEISLVSRTGEGTTICIKIPCLDTKPDSIEYDASSLSLAG